MPRRRGSPTDLALAQRSRAEALFNVAMLSRTRGMELLGTEGPPDVAALDGNFSWATASRAHAGPSTHHPHRHARPSARAG